MEPPEHAVSDGFDWGRARSSVQQRELSKRLALLHVLDVLLIDFNRDPALLDDEEETAGVCLVEDVLVLSTLVNLHLLYDFCPLIFREAREEEMWSNNFWNFAVILIGNLLLVGHHILGDGGVDWNPADDLICFFLVSSKPLVVACVVRPWSLAAHAIS